MTALDYILDGLEAELALEREFGVRSVACDRELLKSLVRPAGVGAKVQAKEERGEVRASAKPPIVALSDAVRKVVQSRQDAAPRALAGRLDFAFLHDRPLSPDGVEMMAKIIAALGRTPETAPIVTEGPMPQAKVLVVLGGNALKKWFPGMGGAPGQWIEKGTVRNVLVTYSPEFILRFGAVTPKVKAIKLSMWQSLKSIEQRLKTVE